MRRLELTDRDLSLFRSLGEYRHLTVRQVERLHFESRQTALRRLRLLAAEKYVTVAPAPSLGTRVVSLARRGHAATPGPDSAAAGIPRGGRSALFLDHTVAVNEFRIALAGACRNRTDVELLGFVSEREVKGGQGDGRLEPRIRDVVATTPGRGAGLSHVPDGVLVLRRGGRAALFFLEVDRATEAVGRPDKGVGKCVRFYAHYLAGTGYQRYREDFGVTEPFRGFRALIVVPSTRRLASIRERAGRLPDLPSGSARFIWLSTETAVQASGPLECSWVSLHPNDATTYTISPHETEVAP